MNETRKDSQWSIGKQTALAWCNLTSDPRRLALALAGIGFAVILMFMQTGFRNALFDSTVRVVDILDADLLLVSSARYNLATEQRFDRQWLRRAELVEGVKLAQPIFLERVAAQIRVVGKASRPIRVIALDPKQPLFRNATIQKSVEQLTRSGDAILDSRSKSSFGFEIDSIEKLKQQEIELAGKQIHFIGEIELGTDFVHDGNLITSAETLQSIFTFRNGQGDPLELVDIGLVQIADGADLEAVRSRLEQLAPNQWDVFTPEELSQRDIQFWGRNTPIGIIFGIGTLMGLIVGTIICYQILYNDISDQIAELATLKAMGYGPRYFLGLVLSQSIYLACLGFIPGLIIATALFGILSQTTGLIMELSPMRIAMVFLLTVAMCSFSGVLAVRKLWSADPASLF